MAAVPRDMRDCKHQQDGQTLKASWQPGIAVGRKLAKYSWRWKCSSVPLHKESERCFHEEWLWHSCRVPETTKAVEEGGWNSQRVFSKVWKPHSPLCLGLCCRHKSTRHPRVQVRESYGNHTRHMAGPTHVGSNGIFEMKTRPPSLALLLQTCRKGYLGCSFSEASWWKGGCGTQPTQFVFFPPHLHVWKNHRHKHGFYPVVTSSRNGVCACCIRGMGWWPVAAWKTLGISVLPTEAPQHPERWLTGGQPLPRVMLLAMLPCQVLQQSGSADTAGAYRCLLISGCMQ